MANKAYNSIADAGASAAVAELLPDPTMLAREPAPGSADDLIASIADQQIDALISESEHLPMDKSMMDSAVAAELAVQATQELQQMARELSDEATADLVADLNGAATEAMLAAPAPATEPEPALMPSAVVGSIDIASLPAQVSETPAPATIVDAEPAMASTIEQSEASVLDPVAQSVEPTIAAAAELSTESVPTPTPPIDAVPAVGPAMTLTASDAEINQDEIDALISNNGPMPSAPEARSAPTAATEPLPHHAHAADIARNFESGAEAVAQELAEDAAQATSHMPPIIIVPMRTKVRLAVSNTVMTALTLVNLPVRNLSDHAREIVGIVAIVTLVNAMSMLLYLMIFR